MVDPDTGETLGSDELHEGDTISYTVTDGSPEGSTVTQDESNPLCFYVQVPDTAEAYDVVDVTVRIADESDTTLYEYSYTTAQVRDFYYLVHIEDADGNELADVTMPDGEDTVTVYPKLYQHSLDGEQEVTDVTWTFYEDDCFYATQTDDGGYELAFSYDDLTAGAFSFGYKTTNDTPDLADDSGYSPWYWVYRNLDDDSDDECDEHDWQTSLTSWPTEDGPGTLTKTCSVCGTTQNVEVYYPQIDANYYDDSEFLCLFGLIFRNNLGDIASASPSGIVGFTRLIRNVNDIDENGSNHAVCLSYEQFLGYVDDLFATHEGVEEYLKENDYIYVDEDEDALVLLGMAGFGDSDMLDLTSTETTSTGRVLHGRWLTNPTSEVPAGEKNVDWVAKTFTYEEDGETKAATQYYTIGDKVRLVLNGTRQVAAYELDVTEDLADVAEVVTRRDTDDFNLIYPAGTKVDDGTILMFMGLRRTDDGSSIESYEASVSDVDERTKLVTFTGTGSYTGTLTKEVNLVPVSIKVADVPFRRAGTGSYPRYDDTKYVSLTADLDGQTRALTSGVDFEVGYEGDYTIGADKPLLIWGLGDYYGWIEGYTYNMVGDIAKTSISVGSLTYKGKNLSPKITVSWADGYAYTWMDAPVAGTDYVVSYKNSAGKAVSAPKAAGTYKVTIKGKGLYTGSKSATFSVGKATQTVKVKSAKVSKTFGNAAFALGATTNGDGTLTYSSSNKKVATVSSAGKVTIKGAGSATITVYAKAGSNYKASAKKTIKLTVAKAANTVKASAKTASVKLAKVKKANQVIKRANAIAVSGAKGTVTYAKASGNAKIVVNTKTGNLTVKKGLAKGTYKVKVKVKAAGTANYKAATKTVTVTIKVS